MTTTAVPDESPRLLLVILALIVLLVLAVRVAGFSDLYDNAQPGPVAHMLDITENGRWLMQREPSGELATKPPLYPWIGALCIKLTGRTDEWVFKFPIVISFLAVTWLIYDLARRALGISWALVAAGFWVANYHVFKLAYTARTDMLLTLWIVLGVWSVQLQRPAWSQNEPAQRRRQLGLIAVFWLSVAMGLLTKGPPVLLSVGWLVVALAWDRGWKRCSPVWQIIGLVAAAGVFAAWLVPAVRAFPVWTDNIQREVVDRVSGQGSGAHRRTSIFAIPGYFIGRFAPWAVLCIFAAAIWRRWASRPAVGWALGWILLVLVVFMIPKGKRADYIIPAYAGGAIVAAAVVRAAAREAGRLSTLTGMFLGCVGVVAVVAPLAMLWKAGMPATLVLSPMDAVIQPTAAKILITISALAALAGGALVLAWRDPPQFAAKSLAAALGIAGILGVYHNTLSPAARSRAGDYIKAVASQTLDLHRRNPDVPLVFHDVGKTPVQALLGNNDMEAADKLSAVNGDAILVVSHKAWQAAESQFIGRGRILIQTEQLPESRTTLMLVRVAPASAAGGAP